MTVRQGQPGAGLAHVSTMYTLEHDDLVPVMVVWSGGVRSVTVFIPKRG